jgi:DNA primase
MSVVEDIKARLDIVDVVSGYIPLQRAGRNFKARCPFHAEKTPSFVVNTERQSWHCFGACSTGGDAFSFVMRQEKLDFGEALRTLAQKTGVELGQRGERDRGDVLFRVNQEAARFYQETLRAQEGRVALDYLTERGVDYKTASDFQLGASPRGRDGLKSHLTSLGFEIEDAVKAGLLRRNEDGTIRDFFWGRLMFPIHDRRGRVTGFGGRSLDGSDPKYINTAATSVFDKRTILYGLHRAIDAIREQDTAIIVEGYMDVIAAHQFSHANVVASMGTALTERQVGLIRSAAGTFVLALDPDTAGQEATLRSLESAWQAMDRVQVAQSRRSVGALYQTQRLDLRIAALPAGLDPDKLIREDAAEWARIVGDAVPYMDFYIPAKARQFDLATTQGKSDAAEAILSGFTSTINPFEQERLFRMLARVLDVAEADLRASIGTFRPSGPSQRMRETADRRRGEAGPALSPLIGDRRDTLEEFILGMVVDRTELWELATHLDPDYFRRIENREVFTCLQDCSTIEELRERLDDSLRDHLDYLAQIDLEPIDRPSAQAALEQSARRLEQRHLQEIQEGLLASDDESLPPSRDLEEQIIGVNARLKELFSK